MPVEYAPRSPSYSEPDDSYEDDPAPAPGGHAPRPVAPRSNAAGYTAIGLVIVAVFLVHYTLLIPVLIGSVLLSAGVSLLGTRLNPLTPTFYLTTKPTWSSIGLVFLAGVGLWAMAYDCWRAGLAPLFPTAMP
jgi:hypothetical protein